MDHQEGTHSKDLSQQSDNISPQQEEHLQQWQEQCDIKSSMNYLKLMDSDSILKGSQDPVDRDTKFDVPGDGSCLFWAVVSAYLIPVNDNNTLFNQRYEALFGNEMAENLDHVRKLVSDYNPLSVNFPFDETFTMLVTQVFRNRVVDYMEGNQDKFESFSEVSNPNYKSRMRLPSTWGGDLEIQVISLMLSCRISVLSGQEEQIFPLSETAQSDSDTKIKLFHVDFEGNAGNPSERIHFNFGLEQCVIDAYQSVSRNMERERQAAVKFQQSYCDNRQPEISSQVGLNSQSSGINFGHIEIFVSSKEHFEDGYKKLCSQRDKAVHFDMGSKKYNDSQGEVDVDVEDIDYTKIKKMYLQTSIKFEKAIQAGDINMLRNLNGLISPFSSMHDAILKTVYNDDNNPIRNTNLIILACKYNQPEVLSYLNHSEILYQLPREYHVKSDDTDQEGHNAFYYAMHSGNVNLLEMLYDYWSGDLHWLGHEARCHEEHVVENLKAMNQLLINARNDYERQLEIEKIFPQQMLVDVHGIWKFNSFQIELYSELSKLRAKNKMDTANASENAFHEVEAIKNMILIVFRMYEKYSDEDELRLPNISPEAEARLKEAFLDNTTLYWKYLLHKMYEFYFRKLNFSVCLLILDNLYLLKQKLKMPDGSYQKIESKLYYFIYCVSNNWDFYLPETQRKFRIRQKVSYADSFVVSESTISPDTLDYSAVIYLEKRDFQTSLQSFKDELEAINIPANIVQKNMQKLSNEEVNSLTMLPCLRDNFSLSKIIYYLGALSVDLKGERELGQLIIERILQVTGEFLKTTDESLHLSPVTEALLQAEIPIETVKQLKSLRDLLSHVDKGTLLARIEIEKNQGDVFDEVYKDLQKIKEGINEVIQIQKQRVHKELIRNGINLVDSRIEEILKAKDVSVEVQLRVIHEMKKLLSSLPLGSWLYRLFYKKINDSIKQIQKYSGFSVKLVEELLLLKSNVHMLANKREDSEENFWVTLKGKFLQYIEIIQYMQQHIDRKKICDSWSDIKNLLLQLNIDARISDSNFIEEDIGTIRALLKERKSSSTDLEKKLIFIESLKPQWNVIKGLLEFIVKENGLFNNHPYEIKHSSFSNKLKKFGSLPSSNGVYVLDDLLQNINDELVRKNIYKGKTTLALGSYGFEGIKKFEKMLREPNFMTEEEKCTVLNSTPAVEKIKVGFAKLKLISYYSDEITLERNEYERLVDMLEMKTQNKKELKSGYDDKNNFLTYKSIVKDSSSSYDCLLEKLDQNVPINKKDHTKFVKSLKLDANSEKMLLNLVCGEKRDPKLLECLSNRVNLLKKVLTQNGVLKNQLVLRYMHDNKFRAVLELLVVDLMNILKENKQKKALIKSCKLLAGVNMRNVLEHGNPLLEIVGNVLDPNDLPTELISKALAFTEDEESINALRALIAGGKDLAKIKKNLLDTLSAEQQHLVNKLKESSKWKYYLKFIPTDHQPEVSKTLKQDIDSCQVKDEELLRAVKAKTIDLQSIESLITQGASVDFVDGHGKASLHYAAMSAKKELIEVLIRNNANKNITDERYGRSSLHYAVMNGHLESVQILLEKGANICIKDQQGKGLLYYSNQHNHADISLLLARYLTVQVGYILQMLMGSKFGMSK